MADLSENQRRILSALRGNSRMSVTELAAMAGVTRATAKTQMDHMIESGRIRRFTIETDVDVEGEVRAITMVELQGKMSRSVTKTLSRIPGVSTIYATNGAWDLVVEIRTDSLVSFDRILREIREIPGVNNSESSLLLSHVVS